MINESKNRKSLEDYMNDAKDNRKKKKNVLVSSCPLEFNMPYPGLCTDVDIEDHEGKTRYAVSYRMFNNSFGTEWTEKYYPYGGGLIYFNALCDLMGTRKIEDFIGKAVVAVLENDGKYSNLRVRATLTPEELQEEWDRLAKADAEAGLIDPLEYARQKKEAITEARQEKIDKVNEMVQEDVNGQLDNLDD